MRIMSIRKFMELFPDEQACRDYLFHIRWPRGFICTKCGESKYSVIKTRRVFECAYCKTQTSTTSNTVMHRTKLPLRYWLFTFYWVASGERCSARKLATTLQIQYRTSLRLLHCVRFAMFRGEFNGSAAFWLPSNPDLPRIVHEAKLRLLEKAKQFIRKYYRRIASRNFENYYSEYRFRVNNEHDRAAAVMKLITSGTSTIYSIHEYGQVRAMKKVYQPALSG